MGVVEADFIARTQEIRAYLDYLASLEISTGVDASLMATMKASAFLMIYNLMESTTTNCIESIYDHLREQDIGFISLGEDLKKMVLRCAKARNPVKLVDKMREEALDLAVAAFERDDLFSGNVDAKKIREMWDGYGISRSLGYEVAALLEIKSARNDLAHGNKSFMELGRSYTVSDIQDKFNSTRSMLHLALGDVERYIANGLVT